MTDAKDLFFKRVIDFYRAPLEHPGFVDSRKPLPAQFPLLLEALNGSGDKLGEVAKALEVDPREYREAAFFYIKQQLFIPSADYYRVLGVNRGASIDQIKKHYRALISLFHPDKNPDADAWDEMYAPRLNEAYNVLKKAKHKSDYDDQLQRHAGNDNAWAVAQHPAPRSVLKSKRIQPNVYAESPIGVIRGSRLWQRFPKLVVTSGLLLIFLAYVGWSQRSAHVVSLQQKKPPVAEQPGSLQQTESEQQPESMGPMLKQQDAKQTMHAPGAESSSPVVDSMSGLAADSPPDDVNALAASPVQDRNLVPADGAEGMAATGMIPGPDRSSPAPNMSKAPGVQLQSEVNEANRVEQAVAASAIKATPGYTNKSVSKTGKAPLIVPENQPPETPPGLTLDDRSVLDTMIVRYLMAYETGNIKRMAALFETVAQSEADWQAILQQQYEPIFESTSYRRLKVMKTHWSFEPSGEARADLDVALMTTSGDRQSQDSYQYLLVLHFVETADGPRLSAATDNLQPLEKAPSSSVFSSLASTFGGLAGKSRDQPADPVAEAVAADAAENAVPMDGIRVVGHTDVVEAASRETIPTSPAKIARPVALAADKPAPMPEKVSVKPEIAPPVVVALPVPEAPVAMPVQETSTAPGFETEPLIERYVSLYQSGELMGMMGLFTRNAIIDGKQGIKYVAQYYDRLFRTTADRQLALSRVKTSWGSPARAQLQLQANIINKLVQGAQLQRYAGEIEMEIVQIEKRLFISRLTQHLIKE